MLTRKKAVVVGGSNGIGLALCKRLIDKEYHVIVLDVCEPSQELLGNENITYYYFNLLDLDIDFVSELSKDQDIDTLFITAGIGKLADFENFHTAEIHKTFTINTVSTISIIRAFYGRIKSNENFYCGVIGSVAGLLSSPMFAVYSASKAGVCRFVESVNIELEANGYENRILNVSPGTIKGTKFYGNENDLSLTIALAEEILKKLKSKESLFIPQYYEIYKDVIERYNKDAHEYGLHSYEYKKASGRAINENSVKIGYLSGTFDLFHVGHLNLIRRAKKQCDYLIVGVHPDASHKGKETFIPFDERKEIVGACKYVDKVVESCKEDSDAWNLWHFNRLFVGSDYKGTERFKIYEKFFKDKGVEIVYFPYTKSTSSTQIRKTVLNKTTDIVADK